MYDINVKCLVRRSREISIMRIFRISYCYFFIIKEKPLKNPTGSDNYSDDVES